jgi:ubiquinone/menaquinone biosynthesis C-methylase UbiE
VQDLANARNVSQEKYTEGLLLKEFAVPDIGEDSVSMAVMAANYAIWRAGIDPSPEMLAIARQKARQLGLEIDLRLGVIEAMPFPDEIFDVVTSSLMIHHLNYDLRVQGLAEIYRVLKPNGRLLIADAAQPSGFFAKQCHSLSLSNTLLF